MLVTVATVAIGYWLLLLLLLAIAAVAADGVGRSTVAIGYCLLLKDTRCCQLLCTIQLSNNTNGP